MTDHGESTLQHGGEIMIRESTEDGQVKRHEPVDRPARP